MERVAIIDLGSNSIRFIIMEVSGRGAYKLVYQEKKSIRLAEGMTRTSKALTEAAQLRAIECLKVYAHIAKLMKVTKTLAVATAAVRNASNGASFLKRVHTACGIPLSVISGKAEAALGFSGVIHTLDLTDFLMFDLGGASVEISLVRGKKRLHSVSIPMGAVNLTEKFHSGGTVTPAEIKVIQKYIREELSKISWLPKDPLPVVGVGGTARNLAKVHQKQISYPLMKMHNYRCTQDDMLALICRIAKMPPEERKILPGLSATRSDIIVAGALVVGEILKAAGGDRFIISGCGLREGLFYHWYDPIYDKKEKYKKNMLLASAQNYLHGLPKMDESHVRYTTALALTLFDEFAPFHHMGERMRLILAVAGLLHDTGKFIDYYSHERHSAYITANAHIFGWSHKEQIMGALLCAFHHGYSDKLMKSAREVRILSEEEILRVRQLSFFLAMAEGLDESHEQAVTRCAAVSDLHAVTLRLYTRRAAFDVPAHATRELVQKFQTDFAVPLTIEWFPESKAKNEILAKAKEI